MKAERDVRGWDGGSRDQRQWGRCGGRQRERERDRFEESVLLGLKMEEGVMSHTIGRL